MIAGNLTTAVGLGIFFLFSLAGFRVFSHKQKYIFWGGLTKGGYERILGLTIFLGFYYSLFGGRREGAMKGTTEGLVFRRERGRVESQWREAVGGAVINGGG
nr:hypothetical protein Iba_scaffold668139CG0020 [Ipomoea batatas]GMC90964.1 hypothetical protein Iba_scaffold36908CG0090 [Ipomoea batatas]GMD86326.1 hypothetical protein Iba_chr14bCG4970 [Ipomoea batatas]